MSSSSFKPWAALVVSVLASFAAAGIGGAATGSSVGDWYVTLHKPSWTPPGWVFGPAWTVLYLLMSIVAWRVWLVRQENPAARAWLKLHGAQLVLNALWSVLFFGLQKPAWALVEILLLWGCLLVLQLRLPRIDRAAAWMWAPYLGWVTFASALNASIWWLNRGGM